MTDNLQHVPSENSPDRILVVDDDPEIREFISWTLEEEGFAVSTAPNGAVALNLVRQTSPDLILLDMRMPVMDGWAFSQAYHQLPGQQAPIIVLTAATDAALFASQISANDYLPKPFDLDALVNKVRQYL
jgi:DNA-binding response OmpR family regulator